MVGKDFALRKSRDDMFVRRAFAELRFAHRVRVSDTIDRDNLGLTGRVTQQLSCAAAIALVGITLPLHLAPAQSEIPRPVMLQLAKQLRSDIPAMRECSSKSEFPFSARAVDLNGDKQPEYVLTSANECECGQVNCSQWVYRAHDATYELLLEASGYTLSESAASHGGYRDIKTTSRDNAAIVDHVLYAYNGKRYVQSSSTIENLDTHETKPTQQPIRFARGASSATVNGTAALAFPDSWVFEAKRGQLLSLDLQRTSGGSATFTLVGPGSTGGHVVADLQTHWSDRLPADGKYTILVDAKGDGRAKYSLTIGIR